MATVESIFYAVVKRSGNDPLKHGHQRKLITARRPDAVRSRHALECLSKMVSDTFAHFRSGLVMALFKKRDDDLVQLWLFNDAVSAHTLRLLLDANEIESAVAGEESSSMLGGLADTGLAGVEVLVRRADLEDARRVMREVPAACDVMIPEWTCLCGEQVDKGFTICWSCGEDHPDDESDS